MVTASALMRHCGHPRALKAAEPTTAKERDARVRRDAAGAKGTLFHDAIQAWRRPGTVIPEVADDEVRGWIEMLAMNWSPRPGMLFEFAVGLTVDGRGVPCDEPQPHVYVAQDGSQLVTAGRADVVWADIIGGQHIVTVRDWKTGKWPVETVPIDPDNRQLQTTALAMAACLLAGADGYRRQIYYVRDGFTDGDELPVMRGTEAWARAADDVWAAAKLDETPRPGEWCANCWEAKSRRCKSAQT